MTLVGFLFKETGRILLKKGYKNQSALVKGANLWRKTPATKRKSTVKCFFEIYKLFRYWNAFPDTYFRFGMFLRDFIDYEQMKSFIPQDAYARYSRDKNSKYHVLIDDKIIFHDLMTHYGLPVPTRYFTFRDGKFRNGSELMTDFEVDTIIQSIDDNRIFVKRYTGGAASGVSIFTKKGKGKYVDVDNEVVNATMIRKKYAGQDFFFEKEIVQEPILREFNPDTVNTIRVLTYKNKIISATVRFGGKGEFVDNVSANGVAVNLDINTGLLGEYGLKMYSTVERFYEHPDSHIKFKDTLVVQWTAVKEIVEKTLRYLPYYCSVGFDVATTPDGPVILEINTGSGINLSQMGKDYGLAYVFKS